MAGFEPRDPDFMSRVRASFEKQTAMRSLGIRMTLVEPGTVELEMPYNSSFCQQNGFLHAGIVTTALDSACGYAAFSLMPAEAAVLTVEFKTNLLAPAAGAAFSFRGQVIRPGRTLTVCEGKATAIDAGKSKLVAAMTCTLMAIYDREGIND